MVLLNTAAERCVGKKRYVYRILHEKSEIYFIEINSKGPLNGL